MESKENQTILVIQLSLSFLLGQKIWLFSMTTCMSDNNSKRVYDELIILHKFIVGNPPIRNFLAFKICDNLMCTQVEVIYPYFIIILKIRIDNYHTLNYI